MTIASGRDSLVACAPAAGANWQKIRARAIRPSVPLPCTVSFPRYRAMVTRLAPPGHVADGTRSQCPERVGCQFRPALSSH